MNNLTASLEDYLETICNYTKNGIDVRAIDISKKLNVSRASVTEALQKLANKGYINYGRYDAISLTDNGNAIAMQIIKKHTILETFFEKFLELPKEEASINACKIEHVITDNAFQKIVELVNRNSK